MLCPVKYAVNPCGKNKFVKKGMVGVLIFSFSIGRKIQIIHGLGGHIFLQALICAFALSGLQMCLTSVRVYFIMILICYSANTSILWASIPLSVCFKSKAIFFPIESWLKISSFSLLLWNIKVFPMAVSTKPI